MVSVMMKLALRATQIAMMVTVPLLTKVLMNFCQLQKLLLTSPQLLVLSISNSSCNCLSIQCFDAVRKAVQSVHICSLNFTLTAQFLFLF